MPRRSTRDLDASEDSDSVLLIRSYLATVDPENGWRILHHFATRTYAGAEELVDLVRGVRLNDRSRLSREALRAEVLAVDITNPPRHSRTALLARTAFQVFRSLKLYALPREYEGSDLMGSLSQHRRRILRPSGLAGRRQPTLNDSAKLAARRLWDAMEGRQVVTWMDNFYWQRFGTETTRNMSLDVTVLAVLVYDERVTGVVPSTRSSALVQSWAGHRELGNMIAHLDSVAADLSNFPSRILEWVQAVHDAQLDASNIRVPLDVVREGQRSLGWQGYGLSEHCVGKSADLVRLLEVVCGIQQHTRLLMPLLVDENIHYRIARLLYGPALVRYNLNEYLREVPVLYGVWHAYKHTLSVLYRAYFPVFALLEVTERPREGGAFSTHRKILAMEKMLAAMLVSKGAMLRVICDAYVRVHPADAASSSTDANEHERACVFEGLRQLLDFWVPAVFHLGLKVRQCYWNGRPGGTVRGGRAREILMQALLMQAHLQGDRHAGEEYTRTLSVALLMWQPWMTQLPGCCFVEEAGEAMLSRLRGRSLNNPNVTTLRGMTALLLTLPRADDTPHTLRNRLRPEFVRTLTNRLRMLCADTRTYAFAELQSASRGIWRSRFPANYEHPGIMSADGFHDDRCQSILRGAVVQLTSRTPVSEDVVQWADDHLTTLSRGNLQRRKRHLTAVGKWRGDRTRSLRRPSQSVPSGSQPSQRASQAIHSGSVDVDAVSTINLRVMGPDIPRASAPDVLDEDDDLYEPPGDDVSETYVSTAAASGSSQRIVLDDEQDLGYETLEM